MYPFTFDTETALVTPTNKQPPLTCLSYASPGVEPGLVDRHQALPLIVSVLKDPQALLVGQNIAFDFGVLIKEFEERETRLMQWVIEAYDANRVTDIGLRQKLLDLSGGEMEHFPDRIRPESYVMVDGKRKRTGAYSLETMTRRHLGIQLDKNTWRLRYGELRDTPLALWEEGARRYPIDDAVSTLGVLLKQGPAQVSPDEYRQACHAFWLHMVSAHGFMTDVPRLRRLQAAVEEEIEEFNVILRAYRVLREDGTRDMKQAKELMSTSVPSDLLKRTEKGGISLDAEACALSSHPAMQAYAKRGKLAGLLTKDIPALIGGEVHTRFHSLLETGRVSASGNAEDGGYNVQNPARHIPIDYSRHPIRGGIRECFIPRHGMVLIDSDYDGLELATMGQSCKWLCGSSTLVDGILRGIDAHLEVAADLVGCSYEEAMRRYKLHKAWLAGKPEGVQDPAISMARQNAKPANFGFPGGMYPKSFVDFCTGQGVPMTLELAKQIRGVWLRRRPEFPGSYFPIHAALTEQGLGTVEQFISGRIRGGCTFTQACNTRFQGLGGDAAKAAGWMLFKACHTPGSPLYGARIVNFVHDQFLLEQVASQAADGALEVQRIMQEAGKAWLPDVPLTTTPCLSRCWSKDAVAVYDAQKRLIPWEEKEAA